MRDHPRDDHQRIGSGQDMGMTASYEFAAAWLTARLRITGDRGATLVEYGLLVVLLAVVCVVAVTLLTRNSQGTKVSPITTGTTLP
jgi:pilus assembly protein Flp/PilA